MKIYISNLIFTSTKNTTSFEKSLNFFCVKIGNKTFLYNLSYLNQIQALLDYKKKKTSN